MNKYIKKSIKIVGGQSKLASKIGTVQQVIYSWLHDIYRVSPSFCLKIERVTKGAVKRHELRPDIFPPEECKEYEEYIKILKESENAKK